MAALLELSVFDQQVILSLRKLPRRVQATLVQSLTDILNVLKSDILFHPPGRYLDPDSIQVSVNRFPGGKYIVGHMDAEQRRGLYDIWATNASALRFVRKGELVYTRHVRHPYPNPVPLIEQILEETKPWLLDKLEDDMIEAL